MAIKYPSKGAAQKKDSAARAESNGNMTKMLQGTWKKNADARRVSGIQKKVSEQITSTDKNAKKMYEGPTPGLEERAGRGRAAASVSARKNALKKLAK